MRKQALLGLLGMLGMCYTAMAVDEGPVAAEKSSVSRIAVDGIGPGGDLANPDDAPKVLGDMIPVELDPHMVFEHVVRGPDGKVSAGGENGGVAGPDEHLIYENILGIHATNFANNSLIADDISTTAPDGCNLTRYRFKVLGKVLPSGAGGAYTVTYALYTNCPNAVGTTDAARDLVKIAGTDGVIAFPDEGPRTIDHMVDSLTPVALPTNVYLGIKFNRSNCGTVVGAPAITGFSGDLWDTQNYPCNVYLGGFPELPHASFWLQMWGSTNCAPAFAGYKCQRPSGGQALPGTNIQAVDDIKLIVNDCNMVGYEVVVKGVGFYTFDLRGRDNCEGPIIPGTERTFQIGASTQPKLQVARFTFDPPIRLTSNELKFGFKCSSNSSGAIIAGIPPIIGESTPDYFIIGAEGCAPVTQLAVHGAVNLAITCAGEQPLGACCDPYLTECNAGADVGKRCFSSANCALPGTCEAVCRQTTDLNCPFPPPFVDQRPTWQLGEVCVPDPFLPNACGVAACCRMRLNPITGNLDEVCENLTKNECAAAEPLDRARLWQIGEYCSLGAQRCPRNACIARSGSCHVPHTTPGCSDPFCCSDICAFGPTGAFCCNVAWDTACVALAEDVCPQAPANDQCAPDFPVRGLEGAVSIPMPGSAATENKKATEAVTDPGFCCNSGVGNCIGGDTPGAPCVVDSDCPDLQDPGSGICSELTADPGAKGLHTVWFKWVQPAGQTTAGVNTCASNSPALDSILQVFRAGDSSSALNACNSLSVIGCNDDSANCSSTQRNSRVCLQNLTPGETYYVLVSAKTESRAGQYRVTLSTAGSGCVSTVTNDYCHRATAITDATPADPLPLVVPFTLGRGCIGGTNAGKPCTVGADCPGGSCSAGTATFECPAETCVPHAQNDIWYNYTATCTGEAIISTCGAGSPDTNLAVYDDCTKCPPLSGNPIGCNDDYFQLGCGLASRVVVDVTEGQCYKVRVSDQDGFPVSGNLTIRCNPIGDCQPNGIPDEDDIANCPPGTGPAGCQDCNGNLRPDECDIRDLFEPDCQPNQIPDSCELAGNDCQPDGIPDDCGGECRCSGFASSVPADCTVDARRPHPPGVPGTAEGVNSLTMTFSAACDDAPGDFTVTCSPTAAPCPTISDVSGADATQTITLSSVVPASNWVCVRHTATGTKVCMGSLPGDVDGNRTTVPADIIKLIDNLNGIAVPPLTLDHCDLDRSNICAPADIISIIDMLNGTNAYIVWNGQSLPVCPSP